MLLQIQETAKLHELAAEQGFGVYMLAFFCTVLMYVVIRLYTKTETLNEKLIETYKERTKIDEHLVIISQHMQSKNYDMMEQQFRSLQTKRKEGEL